MYRFHQSCRKKAAAAAKEIHGSAMGFVANWYNLIDIREYLRESLLAFLYILFNWIVAKLTSETTGILQASIKIDELNIIIVKKLSSQQHCSIGDIIPLHILIMVLQSSQRQWKEIKVDCVRHRVTESLFSLIAIALYSGAELHHTQTIVFPASNTFNTPSTTSSIKS